MQALSKVEAAFGLRFRDLPQLADPGAGEVIVGVRAAGICGSDVHIDDWSGGYDFIVPAMPVTLGHEFSGIVRRAGANALPVGTPVVVIPSVTCGVCSHCIAQNADACLDRRGIGMTRDGGFCAEVLVPTQNCLVLPDRFDPDIAALTEPMVIGARAVSVGGVAAGDRVLVMGPGTIGQAIALMAREAGAAEIVVIGAQDSLRLDVLRALGFDALYDIADGPLDTFIGNRRFDVVLEATGVPAVIDQGLNLLRREGVLVVAGIHPRSVALDTNLLVREQLQLRGSQRGKRRDWLHAFDFVVREAARLAPMITHRLPLHRGMEGFDLARRKAASKVMLHPDG